MARTNVSQTSTIGGIALGPNAKGGYVIGGTKDYEWGDTVDNDTSGEGIPLLMGSGDQHFALSVYADDGGTAFTAGWGSTVFASMHPTEAIEGNPNISLYAVTGQVLLSASTAVGGYVAGVYGVAKALTGVTVANHFFGGNFSCNLPATSVFSAGSFCGGIMIGGEYAGTTSGDVTGIYFANPSSGTFDYAFVFGTNTPNANGMVLTGAASGSQTHRLKVKAGPTDFFIKLHTA
jgi:hypothetical protein